MYICIAKSANHKVDSYPPLCHSRESGNPELKNKTMDI